MSGVASLNKGTMRGARGLSLRGMSGARRLAKADMVDMPGTGVSGAEMGTGTGTEGSTVELGMAQRWNGRCAKGRWQPRGRRSGAGIWPCAPRAQGRNGDMDDFLGGVVSHILRECDEDVINLCCTV